MRAGVVGKQEPQSGLEFDFRHNSHLLSLACCPFRLNLDETARKQLALGN